MSESVCFSVVFSIWGVFDSKSRLAFIYRRPFASCDSASISFQYEITGENWIRSVTLAPTDWPSASELVVWFGACVCCVFVEYHKFWYKLLLVVSWFPARQIILLHYGVINSKRPTSVWLALWPPATWWCRPCTLSPNAFASHQPCHKHVRTRNLWLFIRTWKGAECDMCVVCGLCWAAKGSAATVRISKWILNALLANVFFGFVWARMYVCVMRICRCGCAEQMLLIHLCRVRVSVVCVHEIAFQIRDTRQSALHISPPLCIGHSSAK